MSVLICCLKFILGLIFLVLFRMYATVLLYNIRPSSIGLGLCCRVHRDRHASHALSLLGRGGDLYLGISLSPSTVTRLSLFSISRQLSIHQSTSPNSAIMSALSSLSIACCNSSISPIVALFAICLSGNKLSSNFL